MRRVKLGNKKPAGANNMDIFSKKR